MRREFQVIGLGEVVEKDCLEAKRNKRVLELE